MNGMQPGWMLLRSSVVLEAFQREIATEKWDVAVDNAIIACKQEFPGMPISRTTVKRILAKHMSSKDELVMLATHVNMAEINQQPASDSIDSIKVAEQTESVVAADNSSLRIKFGPRAKYPHPAKR